MIEISDTVEPLYPAATVMLIRDGEQGIEALLVQRSKAVKHMGGMWVFPGGRVDPEDYPEDSEGYPEERDEYHAALQAAIRETREEAGLQITTNQLAYLSHWTTPEGAKRRFATWFFIGVLEDGQEVTVDGGEIANHRWLNPRSALDKVARGEESFRLMPPTYVSLCDLAEYTSCPQAKEALDARPALIYAPRMIFVDDGICFLYQGDAGYGDENLDAEGARHRTYMINGQLQYIRQL